MSSGELTYVIASEARQSGLGGDLRRESAEARTGPREYLVGALRRSLLLLVF